MNIDNIIPWETKIICVKTFHDTVYLTDWHRAISKRHVSGAGPRPDYKYYRGTQYLIAENGSGNIDIIDIKSKESGEQVWRYSIEMNQLELFFEVRTNRIRRLAKEIVDG